MKPFDILVERAWSDPRYILLAEGMDERVVEGADRAANEGAARHLHNSI